MHTTRIGGLRLRLVVALAAIVISSANSEAQVKVNVTTWHNDIGRTGQNTNEPTLTTVLVGDKTKFGRICSGSVDGPVYAQPLVVWDATNNRNIVYVATVNDSIYAFNGGWPTFAVFGKGGNSCRLRCEFDPGLTRRTLPRHSYVAQFFLPRLNCPA